MSNNNDCKALFKTHMNKINSKIADVCTSIDKKYKLFNFSLFSKSAKVLDKNLKKQGKSSIININGSETTISKLEKDVSTYKTTFDNMRRKKYFSYVIKTYAREYANAIKSDKCKEVLNESYKKCIEMIKTEDDKAKEYFSICSAGFKVVTKAAYKIINENTKSITEAVSDDKKDSVQTRINKAKEAFASGRQAYDRYVLSKGTTVKKSDASSTIISKMMTLNKMADKETSDSVKAKIKSYATELNKYLEKIKNTTTTYGEDKGNEKTDDKGTSLKNAHIIINNAISTARSAMRKGNKEEAKKAIDSGKKKINELKQTVSKKNLSPDIKTKINVDIAKASTGLDEMAKKINKPVKEGIEYMYNIDEMLFDSAMEYTTEGVVEKFTGKNSATNKSKEIVADCSKKFKEYVASANADAKAGKYDSARRTIDNGIKELERADKELASLDITKADIVYDQYVNIVSPILLALATTKVIKLCALYTGIKTDPKLAVVLQNAIKAYKISKVVKQSKNGVSKKDVVTCIGSTRSVIADYIKELNKIKEKTNKKEAKSAKESTDLDIDEMLSEAFANGDITADQYLALTEASTEEISEDDITGGEDAEKIAENIKEDTSEDSEDSVLDDSNEEETTECGNPEVVLMLQKAVEDGIITDDQYAAIIKNNCEDDTEESGDTCPGCGKSPCVCKSEENKENCCEGNDGGEDEQDCDPENEICPTPNPEDKDDDGILDQAEDDDEDDDQEFPMTKDEYNDKCIELYNMCAKDEITLEERESKLFELKEAYSQYNKPTYNTEEEAVKALKKRGFETDVKKRLSSNRFAKIHPVSKKVVQTAFIKKRSDGKVEITLR